MVLFPNISYLLRFRGYVIGSHDTGIILAGKKMDHSLTTNDDRSMRCYITDLNL